MEVGSLFNSGILGQSFNWWIGQIADDSTWRENINSGKFEDKEAVPGWGYRYKVSIMGMHGQSIDTIKSEELPFATVMYSTTSGGGQAGAFATPALRQGNVVFGFFMDGAQEQVPVIMGVLGNNLQTPLQTKTELTGGVRYAGISGYAEPQKPKKEAKENVPQRDMGISKPVSKEQGIEKAALGAMGNLAKQASNLSSAASSSLSELRARTAARNNTVWNRVGDLVTDPDALAELAAERRIGLPGLGGGGGGTNSLTEQAKTKTIRTYIGDGLQELVGRTPARLRRDDQYE